ncbi:ATP-binding protein [Streptomyces xanthochromogenes]|uniref:ATP-binding protein n=1 Tax=Streptomyces xanthochromogenes TaxID=67384 RepID=A0ABQ3B0U6_9ACTN|nr:ATP-binding protein [Streptomyces xanthochromogenes]GGY71868.1 ATP-binding protein [Streptomyces xanthochromogenes]
MDLPEQDEGHDSLVDRVLTVSAAFEGNEEIAEARDLAREFLTSVQAEHGLPVSPRAMGMVQLAVSELVTNARKYAPGPCTLTLQIEDGTVQASVWDSSPTLPLVLPADPTRIGQHGLEIVMALSHTFTIQREPVGKRITISIMLADDPGGDIAGRQAL